MKSLHKKQLITRVSLGLFVLTLFAGLLAYWQFCVISAIALTLSIILVCTKHQRME